MAELRSLAESLGWGEVRTYLQSGNLLLRAEDGGERLAGILERGIFRRFGLEVPVIVRPAADWPGYVNGNPFPEESEREPKAVILALSRAAPVPDALERLRERAANGELVRQAGDAFWIHYAAGFARSRLTPGYFDRVVGSPVTTRNWRTVLKLGELAAG